MKKPKAVLEAEAAVMVKVAELEEAKKAVLRIGKELSAARLDVIAAQTTADAELLQCRSENADGRNQGSKVRAVHLFCAFP